MDEKVEEIVNKIIVVLKKYNLQNGIDVIFKKNGYSRCIDASTGKRNKNTRISEYKKSTVYRHYIKDGSSNYPSIAIAPSTESKFFKMFNTLYEYEFVSEKEKICKQNKDINYSEILREIKEITNTSIDGYFSLIQIAEQLYDPLKMIIEIYIMPN